MENNLFFLIDGMSITVQKGTSIVEAIELLDLNKDDLNKKPLACKIGGTVQSLLYKPQSNCEINLLRIGSDEGRRVYERSLKLVLLTALNKLIPSLEITEGFAFSQGVFFSVKKALPDGSLAFLSESDITSVKKECDSIIANNLTFEKQRLDINNAIKYFTMVGQRDKAELLAFRKFSYFDVYGLNGMSYKDYYYGEMLPCSGYIKAYGLEYGYTNGIMSMLMPCETSPAACSVIGKQTVKLASEVLFQASEWGKLLKCLTVSDLNSFVKSGKICELIRINEALHERAYAALADKVVEKDARIVMVAGPSSSGKTTSANRLATQLFAIGKTPIMLSLDNYYKERAKAFEKDNADVDYEHINALDIDEFKKDLSELLCGKAVETPIFNFKTGLREKKGKVIAADENSPIIIEGIHGLNPMLLPEGANDKILKVYVSLLNALRLDDHNCIRSSDMRLLRRLIRDYATRASSMERTLSMWQSVQNGERTWIYPFQRYADVVFNTALFYEPAVLKKYAYTLLSELEPMSTHYSQARALVKFLNYVVDADTAAEADIPPTSVLREFIGGNTFYS